MCTSLFKNSSRVITYKLHVCTINTASVNTLLLICCKFCIYSDISYFITYFICLYDYVLNVKTEKRQNALPMIFVHQRSHLIFSNYVLFMIVTGGCHGSAMWLVHADQKTFVLSTHSVLLMLSLGEFMWLPQCLSFFLICIQFVYEGYPVLNIRKSDFNSERIYIHSLTIKA